MNIDPSYRSDEDVTKEILQPVEKILDSNDEELKKLDGIIREAEQKCKPMLHPHAENGAQT